jgi:diacylglycerol kinase (ATP)
MAGIGVVYNPRSGRNLRDPRAELRLARALGDHGVVRAARSLDELTRVAEDFRRLKIDVLGISGGDGTNHVTITGFLAVYTDEPLPPLAFLRGGTMNTVANSVGVPRGKPDGLLAQLIRRYAERHTMPLRSVERHTMRIGSAAERQGHRHAFIFGTGAIYGFIAEYHSTQDPDALWAAQVLLRAAASLFVGGKTIRRVAQRWEGRVTLDDGTTFPERDYLSIGAGTVDQIGLGFRPFYRRSEAEEHFHILGIHTTALGFLSRMPEIWQARPMGPAHTYDRLARRAVLEARDGVVRYVCDGDVHEQRGALSVEIGPKVRILVEHKAGARPRGPHRD